MTSLARLLLDAGHMPTTDPDFDAKMYRAMRAVRDEAARREVRLGDRGAGERLLASHYEKTRKGK